MSSSQFRTVLPQRAACLTAGAAALVAIIAPAFADVTLTPSASIAYEYNTNRNFAENSAEERETHGGIARVGLDIVNRSARGALRVVPELRFSTFRASDDRNESTDDQYLRVSGNYRWLTADAGFLADYAREALLTSELENVEFPDDEFELPPDPDTGIVTFRGQRERIVLRPYMNWNYTERLSFRGEYTLQDVSFSGEQARQRNDFTNHRLSASAIRNLNPLSSLGLQVSVGRFEPDGRDNSTDSVFAGLVYGYRWSERTRLELTAGAERVDLSYSDPLLGEVDDKRTGSVLQMRWIHDSELTRWRVLVARGFEPDGRGFLGQREELRVNMQRAMSPRLALAGGARWVTWKTIGGRGAAIDRDYFIADVGLDWRWKQALTIGARIEHRYQDRSEVPGTADATAFRLQLSYRGLGPTPR